MSVRQSESLLVPAQDSDISPEIPVPEFTVEEALSENPPEEEPASKRAPFWKRMGLGAKLTAAFSVCALLTALVSGIAWFNVSSIGDQFGETVGSSMPKIEHSLSMAVAVNRLAVLAQKLIDVEDDESRATMLSLIEQGIEELKQKITLLGEGTDVGEMLTLVEDFENSAVQLNDAVIGNFLVDAQLEGLVAEIDKHEESASKTIPSIVGKARIAAIDIGDQLIERIEDAYSLDDALTAAEDLSDELIMKLQPLQTTSSLQTSISNAVGDLNRTLVATSEEEISALEASFSAAISSVAIATSKLPKDKSSAVIEDALRGLNALNDKDTGLFKAMRDRLANNAKTRAYVLEQERIADELSVAVEGIVVSAKETVNKDVEASFSLVSNTRNVSLVLGVLAVFVALGIGILYVSGSIVKRLARMLSAMKELASGELETEVPEGGGDEIGDMARALEIFRSNALEARNASEQRRIDRERATGERKNEMDELAAKFESTISGIVGGVSNSASDVQGSARSLNAVADQSREQTMKGTALSEEMTKTMNSVSVATSQMAGSISEIGEQVSKSVGISNRAVNEVNQTDTQITELSRSASEIGEILNVISDIAAQTNLLALNATIEAARAGESGKGFAVVANEVKSLAAQTVRATDQIAQQIASMQSATRNAVSAVSGVGEVVSEIDHTLSTIAGAVEEQSAVTQSIAQSVSDSTNTANSMASSMELVATGADNTGQEAEKLLGRADQMNEMSSRLTAEIEKFIETVRAA